jgi:hypothetical protein
VALPGDAPLELYRGDTRVWTVAFTDDDANSLDLSDHTWTSKISVDLTRTAADAATITVDDTDSATGELTLTLAAGEAAKLGPLDDKGKATMFWDLQSEDGDGVVQTWLAGKVKVTGDVSVGTSDAVA